MKEVFIRAMENQDKDQAMRLCLESLERQDITIPQLYQDILAPFLNQLTATDETMDDLIWREHILSSIVRSIIEAAYPYVLLARSEKGLAFSKRVLVFCPAREEHEIGARMAADFLVIQGYQVTYMGANTPEATVHRAISQLKPAYLCISVSNRYHLFVTKKLIHSLRSHTQYALKILVGGQAFSDQEDAWQTVGADRLLQSYTDIERLRSSEEDES